MAETDRKKVEQIRILQALEEHFAPTINIIYESYKFNKCEQDQAESVAEYITKLRHLASTYEFGKLEQQLIRDRLVSGRKTPVHVPEC